MTENILEHTSQEKEIVFENIDCVVIDLDNTLLIPKTTDYYTQYPKVVEDAIEDILHISHENSLKIANYYRDNYGSADFFFADSESENVLSQLLGDGHTKLVEGINYMSLYPYFSTMEIKTYFEHNDQYVNYIKNLRRRGKKVIAFTNSPASVSSIALKSLGLDLFDDFDYVLAWGHTLSYPAKSIDLGHSLDIIKNQFEIPEHKILCIGDSLRYDIIPELENGFKACLVGATKNNLGIIHSVENLLQIKIE